VARSSNLQSNFSAGVLEPRLASRTDVEQYNRGAKELTNCKSIPLGGVTRRPGTRFVKALPDLTASANSRIAAFSFSTTQNYVIVFTHLLATVFRASDPYAQVDSFVTPWTSAQLPDINWTQSLDTMIVVHEDHQPRTIVRDAGEDFSVSLITIDNMPYYNFDDDDSPDGTYINERQILTFTGDWVEERHNNYILKMKGQDSGWIWYKDPASDNHDENAAEIKAGLLRMTAINDVTVTWELPNTGGATGETFVVRFYVEFVGGDGGKDFDTIVKEVNNLGSAGSSGADITPTEDQRGGSAREVVWSATRGWPKTTTFHENRLWFGGSKLRPATLWGSQIGDWYNFDTGDSFDDEAIDVTIADDQVNAIKSLYSGRYLEVFTTGGEFYAANPPLAPGSFQLPRQSSFGIGGVKPINLDGATLFVDASGRSVRQYLYEYTEEAYQSNDISILSAHIISSPTAMAAFSDTDGDYAVVLNGDGTLAVLTTNRFQGITSWTKWTTRDGDTFEGVAASGQQLYAIVQRTDINNVTGTVRTLEKFDSDYFTDCGVRVGTGADTSSFGGDATLDHLNGATCTVRSEGPDGEAATVTAKLDDVAVNTADFTYSPEVTTKYAELGLAFNVTVETMPPITDFGSGPLINQTKRISHCTLDLYRSKDVYVDTWRVPDEIIGSRDYKIYTGDGADTTFDIDWTADSAADLSVYLDDVKQASGWTYSSPTVTFAVAPTADVQIKVVSNLFDDTITGVFDVRLLGWGRRPTVTVTQKSPLTFTLLGLETEVTL